MEMLWESMPRVVVETSHNKRYSYWRRRVAKAKTSHAFQLAADLADATSTNISALTIPRRLNDFGWYALKLHSYNFNHSIFERDYVSENKFFGVTKSGSKKCSLMHPVSPLTSDSGYHLV